MTSAPKSKFRKNVVSLAVASALASTATVSNAVNLATDGIGDLAIAPYYTVNNGWETLINLTNTKPYPVAVKVRFHEYRNSRDVFDFVVALSAYDNWTALVTDQGGAVRLNIVDEDTCTVPQRATLNATTISSIGPLGYSGIDDRFESNADGGPTAEPAFSNRLREGYIEFIVMGHTGTNVGGVDTTVVRLPEIPVAASATPVGNAIQSHDCAAVEQAFLKSNIVDTASQFGEPINALKFNFRLLNVANGTEAGGAAETWANFWNGTTGSGTLLSGSDFNVTVDDNRAVPFRCTIDRGAWRNNDYLDPLGFDVWNPTDTPAAALSCLNLITAQQEFDFLDPSVNDVYPVVASFDSNNVNPTTIVGIADPLRESVGYAAPTFANAQPRGVDALSLTIQRSAVVNEWAVNASTGSFTEWVVTFPTKYFYVDQGLGRQFAMIDLDTYPDRPTAEYATGVMGAGTAATIAAPYPPFARAFAAPGQSCNRVAFARFDREQNSGDTSGGVIPSPAPPAQTNTLCYEANVIQFENGSPVLMPENPVVVPLAGLGAAEAGWMKLRLDQDNAANPTVANPNGILPAPGIAGGLEGYWGLPAIGFMLKQRDFNDPALNYTSSVDHGFERRD